MTGDPIEERSPQPLPAVADQPVAVDANVRPAGRKGFPRAIIAIAVVAVLLGIAFWYTRPKAGARPGGFSASPVPVAVQAAEKADLNIYLNALGTVTPLANVTVRPQVSGRLTQVVFQEGHMVAEGELLAVIDPRPFEVALEQAQSQLLQAQSLLQEARTDLARYDELAGQNSIAKQQVDSQRALVDQRQGQVASQQAAVDNAKLNLSYTRVIAPVAGRAGLRQVDQGNYVTTGESNAIVVVAQIKPITVIFTLPEDQVPAVAARMRTGAPIPVELFDRNQTRKLAAGTVATIDNQIDPATGTFKLRAMVPNDDELLFPNQFVNVRMLLDIVHGATVVARSAVEQGQAGPFVFVVKPDNTVTARPVVLGVSEGERVAVTSGLAVGDRVVIDGADKVREGTKVTIPNESGASRTGKPNGPGRPGAAPPPKK